MPYLLTPAEPRVDPVTLYPRSAVDLPALVAAHYERHLHLIRGVRHDVVLAAGDPTRGRIFQLGLPAPLAFTLTRKD